MLTYKLLRCSSLLTAPVLLVIAFGAVIVEACFGVECCPVRDWAMNMAGMSFHHKPHTCCEHEHEPT